MGVHAPTGNQIIIFTWSMTAFTLILVIARTYIRIFKPSVQYGLPRRGWRSYDFLVMFAWAFFFAQSLIATLLNQIDFFARDVQAHHPNNLHVQALKLYYTSNVLYLFCMYCIKCAMLLFFAEFIPRFMRKTWLVWYIAAALVVLSWVVGTFMLLFWCLPISRNWSLESKTFCAADDQWPVVGFTIGSHLLTDAIIYCLPWPVIFALSLPRKQKVGIGITFALGFLCIFFAVALFVASKLGYNWSLIYVFAVLEQTWAVIVACCPAFKELLLDADVKKGWSRVSGFAPRNSHSRNNSADGLTAGQNGSDVPAIITPEKHNENRDSIPSMLRVECRRSLEVRVEIKDNAKVSLQRTVEQEEISRIPISVPTMPKNQFLKPNMAFFREAKTRDEEEGISWAILDDSRSVTIDGSSIAPSFSVRNSASSRSLKDDISIGMPIQALDVELPPIPDMPAAYLGSRRHSVSSRKSKSGKLKLGHKRNKSSQDTSSSWYSRTTGGRTLKNPNRMSWLHTDPSLQQPSLQRVSYMLNRTASNSSKASNFTYSSWMVETNKLPKQSYLTRKQSYGHKSWLDI